MKVSIIIPAYNEEKRIGKTLSEYSKFFENLRKKNKIDYEIIVVINNTKDKTEEIVKKYQKRDRKIKYLNLIKGGKGYAIIEGFKNALKRNNNFIGFVDADMATSPFYFYSLILNISDYDGIIASRWKKNSLVKTRQNLMSRTYSKTFNFIVKSILLLKFNDTQCGAKLFKRRALEDVVKEIGYSNWAFDIELLFKLKNKGYSVKEIPTVWEDKRGSKIDNVRTPIQMFLSVIRLRLINSYFNFLVKAYDKLPDKMKPYRKF